MPVAANDATLSLVVPMRNVATNLASVVLDCLLVVPHYFAEFEIILVDDGSRDDTLSIAHGLAAAHEPVMVLGRAASARARVAGPGSALADGLRAARGDYLLCLQIDNQISIRELVRLIPYSEQHDVVQSYRQPRRAAGQQAVLRYLLRSLARWLLKLDLRDIGCGFTLLRSRVVEEIDLTTPGILVYTEMYARAVYQDVPCIQVGVNDGTASAAAGYPVAPPLSLGTVRELVGLWLRLRRAIPLQAAHQPRRSLGQARMLVGVLLALAGREIWLLLRRRAS